MKKQMFQLQFQTHHRSLISAFDLKNKTLQLIKSKRILFYDEALMCLSWLRRDNILVLDIFFEALNYETIEQKKAYEVAGLLGMPVSLYEQYGLKTRALMLALNHVFSYRRYWRSDGAFHWGEHPDNSRDLWLPLWGKAFKIK